MTLQPDADGSLAEGVVVETRIVARLLGLRLLRVDGVVLLSPGRIREPQLPPEPLRADDEPHRPSYDGVRAGERLALAGRLIASNEGRLHQARAR